MIKLIKQSVLAVSCFTFSLAFSQEVGITNSLPASASAGQPIEAKYTLTKSPTMGSFAKFQVDLPAGFTAETVEIKGGNFTFENNRVKIVWVSLPADATFDFVFKMTSPATATGNITLAPQFFYLENNVKKEYVVPPSSISFGGDGSAVAATTDNTSSTPPATTDNSTNSTPPADNTNNTVATSTDNNSSNTTTTDNNSTNTTPPPPVERTPPPAVTNTTPPPAAKSNVVFHVQLAALTNKPSKSKFAEYGAIKVVEDAGLYKVLVGSFKTLEEARAYKKTLISRGAEGCFVVAYENGVRVKI
ncbi:MAG TPA: SPOR domain-containing protein [Bacteroidia bacterium]|nr:SPOR domain-containing protein [Bacteroidia bacterium]